MRVVFLSILRMPHIALPPHTIGQHTLKYGNRQYISVVVAEWSGCFRPTVPPAFAHVFAYGDLRGPDVGPPALPLATKVRMGILAL